MALKIGKFSELYIYVFFSQFHRTLQIIEKTENRLDKLSSLKEGALNYIVKEYENEGYLICTFGSIESIFFFSETGAFLFPIRVSSLVEWEFVFGVPLSPRLVLALVPKTLDYQFYKNQNNIENMSIYSIGINKKNQKRVLIHPALLKEYEKDTLVKKIEKARAAAIEEMKSVYELHSTIEKMYKVAGIPFKLSRPLSLN